MMLLDQLPSIYKDKALVKEVIGAMQPEIDALNAHIAGQMNQKFIDKADTGLALWEAEYSLPINPKISTEERRSRIKAKGRGAGKVDLSSIKGVASSWSGGSVEVTFDGAIQVTFIDIIGVPRNMDDLKDAVRAMVPAHLGVVFSFRYLTVNELKAMTIAQIQGLPMSKFKRFA